LRTSRISYNFFENKLRNPKPLFADIAYPAESMEEHRYDKVERENLIVKQRKSRFKVSFVGI